MHTKNQMIRLLSKNKTKLLHFFYAHPQQQFYMHEIGRLMKCKPGVFQRAINELEEGGILKSEFKANARYFMINQDYPAYRELKTLLFEVKK
jgi:hypothetical protein